MSRCVWFVLLALLQLSFVHAQTPEIPPPLRAWEGWVMHGEEFRRCPLRKAAAADAQDFECRWPGRLHLAVGATGGEFSQRWTLQATQWIALPGDFTHWPENVTVDGSPEPVVIKEGFPRVRLVAGSHQIRGRFTWSRRPESLQVAPATALVDLTIDGRRIEPVDLRGDRLWLGAVRTVEQPRALDVQIYRLLEDGSPIQLSTRIQLKVAGDAREELLARIVPDGFVALATAGELPFRFEPDGRIRVQVRSGEHWIEIKARAAAGASGFALPTGEGAAAAEEIWGYRSDDRLRITAIEGAQVIDPVQAGVPAQWRDIPTYRLPRGSTLMIAERSRGLNREDANRLSLRRDLWLAFDRRSFDAVDRVTGTLQQGWRLDMHAPYRLLRARSGDDTLLITDAANERSGVEVRTPRLDVTTLSRVERDGALSATGWDTRFESVRTTLHVPPGHRLLAAWGVDDSPDAWLDRWKLLDLFLLTLVSAAAYRLLGWRGAVVAGLAVLLTHQEGGAADWLWINALIAVALASAIPAGSLQVWAGRYRTLSLAALALVLVPFAIAQYRLALHPQLSVQENRPSYASMSSGTVEQPFGLEASVMTPMEQFKELVRVQSAPIEAPAAALELDMPAPDIATRSEPRALDRYAPDALLQTGPGTPDWNFQTYQLIWSGPVDASHDVRLTILTPFWMSVWRLLGVLFSGLLLFALVRRSYDLRGQWRLPTWSRAAPAVMVVTIAMTSFPDASHAQTPDTQTLAELKQRLTRPPQCAPECSEIVVAHVAIDGARLTVDMDVHAQSNVVVGMPHAGTPWIIERVLVDQREVDGLARRDASLELPLTAGVHRVSLQGRVAAADELSLEFPQPPRRIAVAAQGWDSSGTNEGRLLNNALQLTRRASSSANGATLTPQRLPAFVRIRRQAFLNLDWTVTTQVERLAPEEGAFTLRLPVLPGENVLTPGFEVRDGHVLVSTPAGVEYVEWTSSLERVDSLRWTAAANDQPWVEQWDLTVSPTWHAEFTGTPAILPDSPDGVVWVHRFLPRAGETLDIAIVRPAASPGETLAVDRVESSSVIGGRLTNTQLTFGYRSSRGGRHEVRIPEDARLQSISVDGQPLPLRPQRGVLPLTLTPGAHTIAIDFTQDLGAGFVTRPPQIALGADGTNVRTSMRFDEDRWVLFVWGPGVGTAVLYWGELALFIVVALLISRIGGTPLRVRDWLFLGLGLSTFSWWVLLVFATWVFILARRDRWTIEARWKFNALQLALAALSIVALIILVAAIPFGLLGQPNMGLRPELSIEGLSWFMDRTDQYLTRPIVVSVSIWFYKLAMLLWALWLSFALLHWLPWAWRQYGSLGLWKARAAV